MHTSFLYHAFGVRDQECTCIRYKDTCIVLKLQPRPDKLCCPVCKSKHIIRSGTHVRYIRSIPIGGKQVKLEMKVQRISCKDCLSTGQEHLHFVTGKRTYSNRLARLVVELSRMDTIKDIARFLHLSRDTVKEIRKNYLYRHYNNPDMTGVRYIGIDEFAVAKGHVYKPSLWIWKATG
jgi:transposase